MSILKTGEVYDRDEDGQLWLCESFEDTETGEVHSTRTEVDQEQESQE